jgi:hypothetical protein
MALRGGEVANVPCAPPSSTWVGQLVRPLQPSDRADSVAEALPPAGHLENWAHANGRLTPDYVIADLGHAFKRISDWSTL